MGLKALKFYTSCERCKFVIAVSIATPFKAWSGNEEEHTGFSPTEAFKRNF